MRTISRPEQQQNIDPDLRPEYRFDYRHARRNRFACNTDAGGVVITLDPDVAEVFTTPESVNRALRALIKTMPVPSSSPESEAATGNEPAG